jgi:uncharacterized protein Yka (UPF0111/DUF47 family)
MNQAYDLKELNIALEKMVTSFSAYLNAIKVLEGNSDLMQHKDLKELIGHIHGDFLVYFQIPIPEMKKAFGKISSLFDFVKDIATATELFENKQYILSEIK